MEHQYKVEYLNCPRVQGRNMGSIDGRELAVDLEALILEYASKGYELYETQNINRFVAAGSDTQGLIVIFKLKN